MQLRPYQEYAVECSLNYVAYSDNHGFVVAPTGCHAKGQRVIMFDGSLKAVEDVVVGDLLMGDDSSPREVKKLYHGVEKLYKITPKRSEPFIVNENHILSLTTTNEGKKHGKGFGDVVNISVKDYLEKSKNFKHLHKLYKKEVCFKGRKLPLDPYILGVLLGDGSMINQVILHNPELEILNYFEKYVTNKLDCLITKNYRNNCYLYSVKAKKFKKEKNQLKQVISDLGLLGKRSRDKFIPGIYKINSKENRLQLIAGLIDTDGSYSKSCFDYVSKSKKLAEDLMFLVRSVGLSAKITKCEKSCQNNFKATYYRLSISGDLSIVPTKVKRKQTNKRKQKKRNNVHGFDIECVGEGEYFGFNLNKNHLYLTEDFFVHHNSGKSILISIIAEQLAKKGKVLILAHRKELLKQNKEKFNNPDEVGIVSAGLNQKDFDKQITIAGIQTISTDASLPKLTDIKYILIDEVHLLPNNQEIGTYWKVINHFKAQVIGFTATPFRLSEGYLSWGDKICEIHYKPLIEAGYLSPLTNKVSHLPDLTNVKIIAGDYSESELGEEMIKLLKITTEKIIQYSENRKSCLIFCVNKTHIKQLSFVMSANGLRNEYITSDTDPEEREKIIEDFKNQEIKYLLNCEIFTTGFDYPALDMIVVARPTKSKALHEQVLGRLCRVAEGKKDGLVIDVAGNLMEHGGLGTPYIGKSTKKKKNEVNHKVCPACEELMAIREMQCPSCGYEIIPDRKEVSHKDKEDTESDVVYSGASLDKWYDVNFLEFKEHTNKTKGTKSLRIDYYCGYERFSEWLVPFHASDFASGKAWQKLKKFNPDLKGETHRELIENLENYICPSQILVGQDEKNPKYDRIKDISFESEEEELDLEDFIPF